MSPPLTASHDEKYFTDLLAKIRDQLLPKIPTIDAVNKDLLTSALSCVQAAQSTLEKCKQAQADATTDKEKKDTAAAVQAAESSLQVANKVALESSIPILQALQESLLDNDALDALLVQASVLNTSTKQLAEFCAQGERQSQVIDDLLANTTLLREILFHGGAKGGNYGQAMDIYNDILPLFDENDYNTGTLKRLALGTSLELATPMHEFDTTIPVDPIQRFLHYKNALSEMDSTFLSQSTWNFRFITNSDAPNDQLTWGRAMLRNYRPDIMEMKDDDNKWRYCWIVRSDVPYNPPHWTSKPHSYPQILNGGGECGPRAWFGRFILKAFGIPTWGVRQPGHAALGRWTASGEWVICLGAAWKYSWWEDREGLDFVMETQARQQTNDYMSVCRLEWVADAFGEKDIHGKLHPDSLWRSLALLQKQHLASRIIDASKNDDGTCSTCNNTDDLMEEMPLVETTVVDEPILFEIDGSIVMPAVACIKPTKPSANVIFSKSFLGGMQLHVRDGTSLEYVLTLTETRRFNLLLRLVTVHDKMQPLLLTVISDADSDEDIVMISTIIIPYTIGEWGLSAPIEIELAKGSNTLTFAREAPKYGLTLKEIILTPLL